ncbi:hypothetical protein [Streptomyces sp. RM99]|uniref:hypothetical protein n=1 Tax=Streptomyces sp. RM99 TaxID=2824897 RepID=UPI001FFD5CE9|nr:hypothetical protein [Streptomyces sp. RM99]
MDATPTGRTADCATTGTPTDDVTTGTPTDDATTGTQADPVPCRIVVCRDCCCGSPKVTGVDHAAQIERLRTAAPVRVSDCLDVCDHANVVVVQPSAEHRAAGARPVWLGLVNDPDATEDITAWVRAGGPGAAPLPDILDLYSIAPPGRRRVP